MENYKQINPSKYGLAKQIKIVEISKNHLGILKMRKSRIIMKDGEHIMEIVNQILNEAPNLHISLMISGPICSKTIKFLVDNSIDIIRNSIFD